MRPYALSAYRQLMSSLLDPQPQPFPAVPAADIEALVRHLVAATRPGRLGRLRAALAPTGAAMDFATKRPEFKVGLFRFVDVLPASRGTADTWRQLDEYVGTPASPAVVRAGLRLADAVPGLGHRVAAAVARKGVTEMARQFIIGVNPVQVVPRLGALWEDGFASTLDMLGEKTVTLAEADSYAARVMQALEALVAVTPSWSARPLLEHDQFGPLSRIHLSVKPTALAPKLSALSIVDGVRQAMERLEPILELARRVGAIVHLDAEHDEAKDAGLALLREIGRRYPDGPVLGCVVQAYRKDSAEDLEAIIRWSADTLSTPLQVRLVKGAYWDAETIAARANGWESPLYAVKAHSDANYERCAHRMVVAAADGHIRPAFASHNLRSLAFAIAAARAHDLPANGYEVQVLHGMATPLHAAIRDLGVRTRVYCPMGDLIPGMSYLVRRLLENTANDSFVQNAKHADDAALAGLLADPALAPNDAVGEPAAASSFSNEPVAELRRATPRNHYVQALSEVRPRLGFDVPLIIGGVERRTTDTMESVDPGHSATLVCRSSLADAVHVDEAVSLAKRSLTEWGRRSTAERAAVLLKAADLMRRRKHELSALIVFEAGKPIVEADADVCEAIDFLVYYAHQSLLPRPALNQVPGERNDVLLRPRGVGVVISPWNFPLAIPCGMVAGALVTGNCVILKPAEQTPGVALALVRLLHTAGVPGNALHLLPGRGEVAGAALVEHPDVSFIVFTGSRAVGLGINRAAAVVHPGQRHVKKVVAEMGGKNPILIDGDADLDVAVPAIVKSAFAYAGQKCSAASRLIVVRSVFNEVVDRVAGAMALLTIDHPSNPAADLGPVIDQESADRVRAYHQLALREATVVSASLDLPSGGYYVEPVLAVTDDPRSRLATDEIFGPVLTAMAADDLEHAVALADDTDVALTASVFSRSPASIAMVAERLEAGNLYVNRGCTGAMVARQPFGGHRLSGCGAKAGGPDYLAQFQSVTVVTENTQRQGFAPDL